VTLNALLKKTEHYDKDERYMAISDLCEALKRHAASSTSYSSSPSLPLIDASTERRICTAVLSLLDDSSNDVQTVAVKTLGVLLTTVQEELVAEIADKLCTLVLDSTKSDLHDVYAIGLTTLITKIPLHMGDVVSHRLVGRLIDGIRLSSNSSFILVSCFELMTHLVSRFGTMPNVKRQHDAILQISLLQLSSTETVVRKRAGSTIGVMSRVLSDALLHQLVDRLLRQIDLAEGVGKSGKRRARAARANSTTTDPIADTRAILRTMCTVSGEVGHRLTQSQIDCIIPIFLRFCDAEDAMSGDDEASEDESVSMEETEEAVELANELRESCFAGFSSFVLRCPKEVMPHLKSIVGASLAYMRYDPNYSYGDEEEGEEEDGDESSGVEEFSEDEDEYSEEEDEEDDDDDASWKVRRGAIQALTAVVESTKLQNMDPSSLWTEEYSWRKDQSMKTTVAGALVKRFKEREENCRVAVIDCFTRLLAMTVAAAKNGMISLESGEEESGVPVIDLRSKYVPAIVKACEKQLEAKKGGERTKTSALALLSTLCVAPGGIGEPTQIESVFAHIHSILSPDPKHRTISTGLTKSIKLDALCLVRIMMTCDQHDASCIKHAFLSTLLGEVCNAVQEDWYKVIAEALRVLAEVPSLLLLEKEWKAQQMTDEDSPNNTEETNQVAKALYDAIEPRLAAHDLDQEIKECALVASAQLLSVLHPSLSTEQQHRLLSLLLERLKNETTRIAAMKTLPILASSSKSSRLDVSPILSNVVSELASLLRQQSRGVKQSALESLDMVIQCHGQDCGGDQDVELYDGVLRELGMIIVDSDLHISHLSLRASISVLKVCPSSGPSVKKHVLPPALVLSTSPLLQDLALESLLSLLEQLVVSDAVDFHELLTSLQGRLTNDIGGNSTSGMGVGTSTSSSSGGGSKQAVSNLARCIAVITAATTPSNRDKVVENLISSLQSAIAAGGDGGVGVSAQEVQLALLASGDLGRKVNLAAMAGGVAPNLLHIYLSFFDASSEDAKHAAAYALGRASVGAMDVFLPAILNALEQNSQKKQYLLLSALRELIHCYQTGGGADGGDISSSVPLILPHLVSHCSDKEEGVRTMVAECMGSLTCLEPGVMLPHLQELVATHGGKDVDDNEEGGGRKDALSCWTVATAIKFAIAAHADPSKLAGFMPSFLRLLSERDLSVRNAALLMVYSSVHHTPQLVAGLMQEHILPSLHELAQLNLKRVVDLGPFKHTVDDALPLRKAALSIFSTCLEKCPASIDIPAFMPILGKALGDVEDIQLQAHQIIISMCYRHPIPLVGAVEAFVDPLQKTIDKKTGQKTGTELERAHEWIKSGLRTMIALSNLDGVMNCRKFAEFVERTKRNEKYHRFFVALEEER